MENILELKDITKVFPGTTALNKVKFHLLPGEIHALMGENGAGKSTFIKIITGVHRPTEGSVIFKGKEVKIKNPVEAQKLGISAVYQHVTCFPDLSITENIFMGHEKVNRFTKKYEWKAMHLKAEEYLNQLGVEINPRQLMGTLSVAQQQIVEIAKALSTNAQILIMDEPTASLSKNECDELYKIAKNLAEKGTGIIFISHRTEDIFSIADRVTVFRDANYIGTWNIEELSITALSNAMVGREITQVYPEIEDRCGKEIFKVEGLGRNGYFKDISMSVCAGEIVGLTGLVGAGRTEVCESIFGCAPYNEGKMYIEGSEYAPKSSHDAIKNGVVYLSEDRQVQGLITEWSIAHNISLSNLSDCANMRYFLDSNKENAQAEQFVDQLKIKTSSIDLKAESLSGGNQQKVVFAKLLSQKAKLLILDEPTKGVDIGAKTQIYAIINDLAKKGYGILMVSSEMSEVLGMSNKVYVMKNGRIKCCMNHEEASAQNILDAAMLT